MPMIYEMVRDIFTKPFNNYELARAHNVAEATVRRYRRLIHSRELTWETLKDLDTKSFYGVFNRPRKGRGVRHQPDLALIEAELTASGMDLQSWYHDHLDAHPDTTGFISYSHLAAKMKAFRGKRDLIMRQVHTPGEKVFVDYCGDLPHYVDRVTGQKVPVQLFVGVLGASSLLFATATATQRVPDFIAAHVRMFDFFGGRTDAVVPDNLASAVARPGPDLVVQRSYADLARHYDMLVLPARPRTPTDKPKAEAGVKLIQRAMKRLCYRKTFHSLAELNAAIAEVVNTINSRPMKGGAPSRRERFEKHERHRLLPLPATVYSFAEWKTVIKVPKDYHVLVDGHFYSVPHGLVGERVDVRLQDAQITVFHDRKIVADHPRQPSNGKSSSSLAHMPPEHRAQAERAPNMLQAWAKEAGPNVIRFVQENLDQARPIRGVQAVETIKKLAHEHGASQVNTALERAYRRGSVNVSDIRRQLSSLRKRQSEPAKSSFRNVAGAASFSGGSSC